MMEKHINSLTPCFRPAEYVHTNKVVVNLDSFHGMYLFMKCVVWKRLLLLSMHTPSYGVDPCLFFVPGLYNKKENQDMFSFVFLLLTIANKQTSFSPS